LVAPIPLTANAGLGQSVYTANRTASIEDTDALLTQFRFGYQASQRESAISYRHFFEQMKEALVFRLAACLADRLREEGYLLTNLGSDQTAVKLELSSLLKRARATLGFDGDSISLLSGDAGQGMLIDFNKDDPLQTFEVAVWGVRWLLAVLECESA
jgi:hypothetical protein